MTKKHKFDAHIEKVLKLMINSIYTNKDIFLRELISNASDALDKLRYLSIENDALITENHSFNISVTIDKNAQTLIIADNGIGMNKEDLIANLGTIASSGTSKFLDLISQDPKGSVNLIGQFGVGFYSVFMVADHVEVLSRKAGEDKTYSWISDGEAGYDLSESKDNKLDNCGTVIKIHLKDTDVEYLDKYRIKHIISTYSDHINFPINLQDEDGNIEQANRGTAIWAKPKNEISEQDYQEFYRHVSHMPDEPWMRIHYKAEGNVNYNALIFIPSMKPFDLFHPDRKTSVKLYIKNVFITDDNVKLIPEYMRFLRGVVDCEDLPLNISRETIQNNVTLEKLKKSLVKKILNELKSRASSDPSSYKDFWLKYGEVMKEGLCIGSLDEKQELLEICRFHQLNDSENLISLDSYIDQMQEGQEQIFFVTGDDLERLRVHPRLEGFKSRGINVLLLADHVDDFWVNVVNQYKNKELKNISHSDFELDNIKKETNNESAETEKAAPSDVLAYFKKVLGNSVKDVVKTSKLVDSPACLAIAQGNMSIRMEKILIEQKQLKSGSTKILELNLKHPIITKIAKIIETDEQSEVARDLSLMVYDQACILDGESLTNPVEFCKRLNKYMAA